MKRPLSVFLLLLGAANAAFAQAPPLRLTLDEAVTRGIEASHRLQELSARQEAAQAIEDQREAAELPQFAAMAGVNPSVPHVSWSASTGVLPLP